MKQSLFFLWGLLFVLSGNFVFGQDLFHSAQHGNLEDIKKLVQNKTDINVKNKSGFTPLMIAISFGHTEVAEYLIQNGADINAKGWNDLTPLMTATRDLNLGLTKLLIEKGADINAKTTDGKTALSLAKDSEFPENKKEIIKYLKSKGAK